MDLVGALAVLRRHAVAAALCIVAGVIGGVYFGFYTTKTYEATSRVLVNVPTSDQLSQALAGAQLSATFVQTYARVAASRPVAEEASAQLGSAVSAGAIEGQLTAQVEQDTYIIDLTVADANPARASQIANAVAQSLSIVVERLQQGQAGDHISVRLLERAQPPLHASSPRPRVDVGLGVGLGIVAGLALVALLETLDRSVKSVDQVRSAAGLGALAVIPRHRRGGMRIAQKPGSPLTEAYRELRTSIRFSEDGESLRAVLICGCVRRDGATTTAVNLALAFAASGDSVLLLDGDLRHSSLTKSLSLADGPGLGALLVQESSFDVEVRRWQDHLDVLPAGPPVQNASELVGSQAMADIIAAACERYDVVVIDAPPVQAVTDAVVLAAQADAVVLVAKKGSTPLNAVTDTAGRMRSVGLPLLGVVVNAVPTNEAEISLQHG